ncbi:MAG: DUF3489 domain-containing protein [Defluviicoccus sp.]|nr:MAG: DUF3489 domain-containing protein [Defluviicoccus sp.]
MAGSAPTPGVHSCSSPVTPSQPTRMCPFRQIPRLSKRPSSPQRRRPSLAFVSSCWRSVSGPAETRPDVILAVLRAAIERAESRRRSRPARPAGELRRPRENSKEAQLIGMLRRPEGATIAQMMTQMAWMAHTVRGVLAGALKKRRGLNVISEKPQGGERVYRLVD